MQNTAELGIKRQETIAQAEGVPCARARKYESVSERSDSCRVPSRAFEHLCGQLFIYSLVYSPHSYQELGTRATGMEK